MSANRNYKDSVFSLYMSEPHRLIEVYNAIQGTNYGLGTEVQINTLEEAMFKSQINDVSFLLDGRYVVLVEHQSTVNENMPLRMLLYIGRLYEKQLSQNKEAMYKKTRMPIHTPEFLVLYNGVEEQAEEQFLRLSTAFTAKPHGENTLELVVKVLNIRYGHNEPILSKSKVLSDYSRFIDLVQRHSRQGKLLEDAIREAIQVCVQEGIMQDFLMKHGSEVMNMLFQEWEMDTALKVEREEAEARGEAKGQLEAKMDLARKLLSRFQIAEVADLTGLSVEKIKELKS